MLRGGILLAVAFILLGIGSKVASGSAFPSQPVPLYLIAGELGGLSPAVLLSLGVLLLILTPVARVFLSVLVFADERDWTYVLITAIVFANLMVGVVLELA